MGNTFERRCPYIVDLIMSEELTRSANPPIHETKCKISKSGSDQIECVALLSDAKFSLHDVRRVVVLRSSCGAARMRGDGLIRESGTLFATIKLRFWDSHALRLNPGICPISNKCENKASESVEEKSSNRQVGSSN